MTTEAFNKTKVAQVLRDGAVALRKTAAERDTLLSKVAELTTENNSLKLRMDAEKVAMDMTDKGMAGGLSTEALIDQLEKKAHADPRGFEVLREAVNITGPDMFKAASVASDINAPTGSDFERYILGDVS